MLWPQNESVALKPCLGVVTDRTQRTAFRMSTVSFVFVKFLKEGPQGRRSLKRTLVSIGLIFLSNS